MGGGGTATGGRGYPGAMRGTRWLTGMASACIALACGCGRSQSDGTPPVTPFLEAPAHAAGSSPTLVHAPAEPTWNERLAQVRTRYENLRRRLAWEANQRTLDEAVEQAERQIRFFEASVRMREEIEEERRESLKRLKEELERGPLPGAWEPPEEPANPGRRR